MIMLPKDVEKRTEIILSRNDNEKEGGEENELCGITKRKIYLF